MKRIFSTSLLFLAASTYVANAASSNSSATSTPTSSATASAPADYKTAKRMNKKMPEIEVEAKSVNGATTWVLKNSTVKAGQTYLLVAHHDLATGPAEHGLTIKELGISTVVKRGKKYTALVNIPADKKGKIEIGCQLHPKHVPAILTVE